MAAGQRLLDRESHHVTSVMATPEQQRDAAHRPGPPNATPRVHPLVHAGKFLVADLASTLVFVALYAVTHSIFTAAGVAIALGLGRILYLALRGIPIDAMQWLSLLLVVAFGGATLLTRNPIFVMLKPTIVYAAIGSVMLRRGWMNRYMDPIARTYGSDVTTVFGYLWATLLFATGAANLGFALLAGPVVWAWFVGIVPLATKLAMVIVQYVVTQRIIRRRIAVAQRLALIAS